MSKSPIKVFLAEDSPVALNILQRILDTAPEIEVVGVARNGKIALEQIPQLQPDVICTDLLMGKMDGLELTRQLMAKYPRPILVISQAVQSTDTNNIGQLLAAGAVDVFPKPNTGLLEDYQQQRQALIEKIRILAGVRVFTKRLRSSAQATQEKAKLQQKRDVSDFDAFDSIVANSRNQHNYKIIGIGVSTGGPNATEEIFSTLPANFPLPIVCVQHISEGFLDNLISWLDSISPLKVKIAEPGEFPTLGNIYFPWRSISR
ncbi:MAG: chemotaxis protein CheB [Cyanobacteria bacterium P01_F01_bin.143]